MARLVARISIALTGAVYFAFGLALLVWPAAIEAVGVELVRPAGFVEIRGYYGGLGIGAATYFWVSFFRSEWHVPALFLQIATLGGMGSARALAILIGGGGEVLIIALLIAELSGAALGSFAIFLLRRELANQAR